MYQNCQNSSTATEQDGGQSKKKKTEKNLE